MVIGLIVPRMFILSFGSEMNGLQSSIAYIYTYIALLEAGLGTATVQALFGPVGRKDYQAINGILSATRQQYLRIALMYGICMVGAAIIFPFTLTTTIEKSTISILVMLSGCASMFSFLFYGKLILLLQVDGRTFIPMIIGFLSGVLHNLVKIVLLYFKAGIIQVYLGGLCINLLPLIAYYCIIRKYYPWLNYKVTPNLQTISQRKYVVVQQIAGIITISSPVMSLTYIAKNLALVSVYNLYCMIFDSVKSLIINIFSSVHFIMGQTFYLDSELYRKYHEIYTVANYVVAFTLYSVAYKMILPFMALYTQKITDINYIDPVLALLFVISRLLYSLREPDSQLINYYAGHFKKTQNRVLCELLLNLVGCMGGVLVWGIHGVLLGTIISYFYRFVDMTWYANKNFLHWTLGRRLKPCIAFSVAFLILIVFFSQIHVQVNGYLSFFVTVVILTIAVFVYFLMVAVITHRALTAEFYDTVLRRIK